MMILEERDARYEAKYIAQEKAKMIAREEADRAAHEVEQKVQELELDVAQLVSRASGAGRSTQLWVTISALVVSLGALMALVLHMFTG